MMSLVEVIACLIVKPSRKTYGMPEQEALGILDGTVKNVPDRKLRMLLSSEAGRYFLHNLAQWEIEKDKPITKAMKAAADRGHKKCLQRLKEAGLI